MLTVLRAGPLTTVQDLGRPGYAHLGVPRSGAADRPALRRANRMVGNPEDAAGLETTLLGTRVRLEADRWVAVTGAGAEVSVDGRPVRSPFEVRAGAALRVGTARRGLRSYLAVGGGIAVPEVLGSRSTDRLSGLGPAPLRDGDRLPLGPPTDPGVPEDEPELPAEPVLRLRTGPRADWFAGTGPLTAGAYTVGTDSDRIGLRLDGPRLTRVRHQELPSEGLVLGAVQVPADGRPVLFLADHPTTGGYPVVGVVHPDDVPLAAQARPGGRLRFQLVADHPVQ
ncbi:MAG: biotin-dependent carboxyltransferase family protein [Mycobacteriales bacterium]